MPSTLDDWRQIALAETQVLARFPEETDRHVVRDLLRWQAELLLRLKREPDAKQVLRQAIDLMSEDRQELFDLLDWALEREVWFVADEVAARFPAKFREDPLLLYRWAEGAAQERKDGSRRRDREARAGHRAGPARAAY